MLVPPHVPFWSLTGAAEQCPGVEGLTPQTHQREPAGPVAEGQEQLQDLPEDERTLTQPPSSRSAPTRPRWPSAVSSATPAQSLPLRRGPCVPLGVGQRVPALALLP